MNYFIAGLPRSRSAWLSVFMSQSGQFCHHDGFNGCNSIAEYKDKIGRGGDSSTGLTLIDIHKEFPHAKVVIIEKSDEEFERCVEWCDETYGQSSRKELESMREKLSNFKGLRVQQSEINERLEDVWTHLTSKRWDDKYSILADFNIQANPFNINLQAARNLYESLQQDSERVKYKASA